MRLRLLKEGNRQTLYSIELGNSASDYLANLEKTNASGHAQIMRRLEYLADSGAKGDQSQFRPLGNGLFEAKARSGPRVLFFYDEGSIVLCVAGLNKQSKKTPKRDFETALSRKKAYLDFKKTGGDFVICRSKNDPEPRRKP